MNLRQVRALGLDVGKVDGSAGAAVPKADSMYSTLVQALQSDDKTLLEQVRCVYVCMYVCMYEYADRIHAHTC